MDQVERNRLSWKCRRGLLELDIVLDRFLKKNALDGKEAGHLGRLLELPDNELWDIVTGRSDHYQSEFEQLVARLRAA